MNLSFSIVAFWLSDFVVIVRKLKWRFRVIDEQVLEKELREEGKNFY
jgi:hypothetical protein